MSLNEPIGLAVIEQRILDIDALLEKCTLAMRGRWEEDAAADTEHAVSFGQAFLMAKEGALPGQEQRDSDMTAKQRATVVCAVQLSRRNSAHALLESAREAARNYRSRLEGLRSLNANVRQLTSEEG